MTKAKEDEKNTEVDDNKGDGENNNSGSTSGSSDSVKMTEQWIKDQLSEC